MVPRKALFKKAKGGRKDHLGINRPTPNPFAFKRSSNKFSTYSLLIIGDMKAIVLLACLAAVAMARPQKEAPVEILSYTNNIEADGVYDFSYETADGTSHNERGYQKPGPEPEENIQVAEGSYSFTADDGQVYTVTYIADENGFQPQGDHLPTPPPIPEAIQRALDYIASLQEKGRARA